MFIILATKPKGQINETSAYGPYKQGGQAAIDAKFLTSNGWQANIHWLESPDNMTWNVNTRG